MIGRAYSDDVDTANDDDCGEGFEFDIYKMTKTLFESFGLMDDAKHRSVELGLASDGVQLTHTLSHVAAGLKFNDMGMRDPFSNKQPLLFTRARLTGAESQPVFSSSGRYCQRQQENAQWLSLSLQ
jgi:hypothetical protein